MLTGTSYNNCIHAVSYTIMYQKHWNMLNAEITHTGLDLSHFNLVVCSSSQQ